MEGGIRSVGLLSVILLVSVIIGQGIWLTKIREIRNDGYHEMVSFTLLQAIDEYLGAEYIDSKYNFVCSLTKDSNVFTWGSQYKTTKLSSTQKFDVMMRQVFYDHLYQNQFSYLRNIDSIYKEKLLKFGIIEKPVLMVWDSSGHTLMATDSLPSFKNRIFSKPIDVGYECNHQFVAAFPEPPIFHSMIWHLIVEGLFLFSFIVCLIWQWKITRSSLKSAKIQTQGVSHLEHELKKPVATMISAVGGIVARSNKELTALQEFKLKLVWARLMKIADVTDTMLTSLKTARLEIVRQKVDVRHEMELITEMFTELYKHAKLVVRVEEGIGSPLLDTVYFNHLVSNLIDNAIKYGGDEPEVEVWFGRDGEGWLLTVTDNGIGMSSSALKKIFRQFYRVKDKRVEAKTGFGLGLAFVKKVVDAYGGEVKVESAPGKGTKFEIRLK